MRETDRILIAGGGPVGLTAALSLAQYGIPFTLLEAADDIFEDPPRGPAPFIRRPWRCSQSWG